MVPQWYSTSLHRTHPRKVLLWVLATFTQCSAAAGLFPPAPHRFSPQGLLTSALPTPWIIWLLQKMRTTLLILQRIPGIRGQKTALMNQKDCWKTMPVITCLLHVMRKYTLCLHRDNNLKRCQQESQKIFSLNTCVIRQCEQDLGIYIEFSITEDI